MTAGPCSSLKRSQRASARSPRYRCGSATHTIGGLNLFSDTATLIADDDRDLAQALADVATIGILQQRSVHRTSALAEQLQYALNSRVVIEQAKGVLAERDHVAMDVAFATLRKHARDHNLKLGEVAFAVVRRSIDPAAVPPPPKV